MQIHTWADYLASLSLQPRSTLIELETLFRGFTAYSLEHTSYFFTNRANSTAPLLQGHCEWWVTETGDGGVVPSAGYSAWRGQEPEVASGTPAWRS